MFLHASLIVIASTNRANDDATFLATPSLKRRVLSNNTHVAAALPEATSKAPSHTKKKPDGLALETTFQLGVRCSGPAGWGRT
ncbi:hypothetical protein LguiA_029846 [Lonicera macranthoides]